MKKAPSGPKQAKSFFNNYKALAAILAFTILNFQSFGQGGWLRPNNSHGTLTKGSGGDSAVYIPTGSGAPAGAIQHYTLPIRRSNLYYDSTANVLYSYSPRTDAWSIVGSGSTNTSVGSGFKVAINGTNNVKSLTASNGLTFDSSTTNQVGVKLGGTGTENTTIDWGAFTQTQTWTNYGSANGLTLSGTGTTSGSASSILKVLTSGTTSPAQTTYAAIIENSRTGVAGSNVALKVNAYGKSSNTAIMVDSGKVIIGAGGGTAKLTVNNNDLQTSDDALNGIIASNNTHATALVPVQVSPSISWATNGWKTDGGGASQTLYWYAYAQPVQGTDSIKGLLKFEVYIDGTEHPTPLALGDRGQIYVNALDPGSSGQVLTSGGANATATWQTPSTASGTVTSVGFTGGLISVANPTTTPAFTVAGTSGGIPYFSSSSTWASSAALAANSLMKGGGAGVAPSTITTGTGVLTALGVNTGSSGSFVVNGGALGTPSSGTLTNAAGLPIVGGTTGTLSVARGGTGTTDGTGLPYIPVPVGIPSITIGTGGGSNGTVSITGTNLAGEITITTGDGLTPPTTNDVFCEITFTTPYGTAPYVVFSPSNNAAALMSGGNSSDGKATTLFINSTTGSFTLNTNSGYAPEPATEYKFHYHVIQ